jgi:hypothetical protein
VEGSAEQKAYSEFNDRLNGMVVGSDFQFLLKEKDVVGHRWLALWPLLPGCIGGGSDFCRSTA